MRVGPGPAAGRQSRRLDPRSWPRPVAATARSRVPERHTARRAVLGIIPRIAYALGRYKFRAGTVPDWSVPARDHRPEMIARRQVRPLELVRDGGRDPSAVPHHHRPPEDERG